MQWGIIGKMSMKTYFVLLISTKLCWSDKSNNHSNLMKQNVLLNNLTLEYFLCTVP